MNTYLPNQTTNMKAKTTSIMTRVATLLVALLTTMTAGATVVTLDSSSRDVILNDGDVITGNGGGNTHVTIADGATVTLSGVNITVSRDNKWAGITCDGDAVIILADGTNNKAVGKT